MEETPWLRRQGAPGKDTGTVAAREAAPGTVGQTVGQPGWALGLGTLVVFLGAVSAAINTISLKPMAAALDAPPQAIIWVSVAYVVPFASVVLVAGKLADAVGHRTVLLGSLVIYTIGPGRRCWRSPSPRWWPSGRWPGSAGPGC